MTDERRGADKKITKAIAFCFGFIVLLVITSYAVKPDGGEVYDIVSTNQKISDLKKEKEETIDVFFAGSSLVFQDISPLNIWEQTGITSYDLSDGAMRLCDQYALIVNASKEQTPGVIVLETTPMFSDASPYKDEEALPTNLIEKIFPIFHYHVFYKNIHLFDKPSGINSLLKGFQPSYDVVEYTGKEDYMEEDPGDRRIKPLNVYYLDKIAGYCRDNGITLFVLSLPSPLNHNKGNHDCVSEWAAENEVDYLDLNLYNEEIGLDWSTDTKDGGDHLNYYGAKKVSSFLADHLKEKYGLEDHRTDEYYSDWNDAYEKAGLK